MLESAPCPACGAVRWVGRPPRCAACNEPLAPDAVAAGDERLPRLEAPLADEVARLANSHRVAGLTPPQRLVYGLLARTLDEARGQDRPTFAVAYALGPLLLLAGVGLALAFMTLSYWLLVSLGLGLGLYAVPGLVALFALVVKSEARAPRIDLAVSDGKVTGLWVGRLRDVFNSGAAGSLPLFLGCGFGLMWGLLYLTPDHGGLATAGGLGECFWLTTDNLAHGVLLDVCELYQLRLGPRVEHTFQSATVFGLFRLAFDALVVLFLYETWQRWRLRRLFNSFPHDPRDVDALLAWVDRACADRRLLPTSYFDEVLFLVLARDYLSGHYALVRQLSQQLRQLPVTPRVRELFRGPGGEVIFEGVFKDQVRGLHHRRAIVPRGPGEARPSGRRSPAGESTSSPGRSAPAPSSRCSKTS